MTRKPKTPKAKASPLCTVRMYCHGLGDCFLITIRDKQSVYRVMIDAGVLLGTSEAPKRMAEVFESIFVESGGKIDLLVVTHQHWDHVSGFIQAQQVFDKLTIAKVWYAWTEDPDDALAVKLTKLRSRAAFVVENAVNRLDENSLIGCAVTELLDSFGVTGRSTEDGMVYPKKNAKAIEYRRPGETVEIFGAKFHVLGPPRDDRILKSDPSKKNSEVYEDLHHAFRLQDRVPTMNVIEGMAREEVGDLARPFDQRYNRELAKMADFYPEYEKAEQQYRRIDTDWEEAVGQLALDLDSDTNNTSLAFALELPNGKVLVFPGDAQVGNWLSWHDQVWKSDGKEIKVGDLFKRTVLYKVGHHGSHNATLREKGLEMMTSPELKAMIPVEVAMAEKKKWFDMPLDSLFARLTVLTKGKVAQADRPETFQTPFRASAEISKLTKRPVFVEVDIE